MICIGKYVYSLKGLNIIKEGALIKNGSLKSDITHIFNCLKYNLAILMEEDKKNDEDRPMLSSTEQSILRKTQRIRRQRMALIAQLYDAK